MLSISTSVAAPLAAAVWDDSSSAESSISCSGGSADGVASEGRLSSRLAIVALLLASVADEELLLVLPYKRNASKERAQVMLQNRRCLV